MFNIYSRRQILKVGGSLIVSATATGSFPLIRTLAAGRAKTVLRFKFTLKGGGKGSFDFNTAAQSTVTLNTFGKEYSYFNAVSHFCFSGRDRDFENENASWKVVPGLKAPFLGLPPYTPGVLSGVNYPNGCSTGTVNACSITVAVLYLGNLEQLPVVSTNPNSYQLIGIDIINPNGQLNRIDAKYSKVIALRHKVDK
ncbi:MAG: hypothetical protein V7L25_18115 [Nostoc sp.]|uniref:hypothetical protein n=1 Tax=Nostoc sp. TaxID=1180 RepID=UPI002FF13258